MGIRGNDGDGEVEFDDGAANEDQLLAEVSEMLPTCIAGIHEFWRNYRKPPSQQARTPCPPLTRRRVSTNRSMVHSR